MGWRLAVLPDFREEGWPSMDLCAEMFARHLPAEAPEFCVDLVTPRFRRWFQAAPGAGRSRWAFNADRVVNRYLAYPRFVRALRRRFDAFLVADHSYAHLLHHLPADRTGVYCHDLDLFQPVLDPANDRRPAWFRMLVRHVLRGFQKAGAVFYSTAVTARQIREHNLLPEARLVWAPLGVADEFTPEAAAEAAVTPVTVPGPFVLHVGSCIPRKRVDVLLEVFAQLHATRPTLHLVQAGGAWTADQRAQIDRLGVGAAVHQFRDLTRPQLADLYRRAAVVLQPSAAEGFGLPVIEALACGTVVVASDLPVLREVGGPAVLFCPVADVAQWADVVGRVLDAPSHATARAHRLAWVQRYTWAGQARTMAATFRRLLGGPPSASPS